MRKFQLGRPSPALVVSIIALTVALGGTSYAAFSLPKNSVGTKQLRKGAVSTPKIKDAAVTGSKVAKNTITGANINLSTLGAVPSADSAANALSLGGIAASGYTRKDCNSVTGQVKGFALIPASSSFSSSFTDVGLAYNCSGQAVQAKRIGLGRYEVKFLGSPVAIAAGNVVDPPGIIDHAFVSFTQQGAGDFLVFVYNAVTASEQDRPFAVITP